VPLRPSRPSPWTALYLPTSRPICCTANLTATAVSPCASPRSPHHPLGVANMSALLWNVAAPSGRPWLAQLRYSSAILSLRSCLRGFTRAHPPPWPLSQCPCSLERRHRPCRLASVVWEPRYAVSSLRTAAPRLAPATRSASPPLVRC
jgi:hypothetical protein